MSSRLVMIIFDEISAKKAFMGRQVSDDVVRSSDATEEVHVETSEISNKFKFFESYREPEKQRKQFRITPPRDGQVKVRSFDFVVVDWFIRFCVIWSNKCVCVLTINLSNRIMYRITDSIEYDFHWKKKIYSLSI